MKPERSAKARPSVDAARTGAFVAALVLVFAVSLPLVTVRLYAADELQYYALLRSLAKDGDVDCRDEYARFLEARPWQTEERRMLLEPATETGVAPNFATVGVAILWAPLFGIGEIVARLGGWPADGYSYPYLAAVCYGSALYAFLGLLLLFDVARREAAPGAACAGVALGWWATALPFYMYVTPPMPHATSVFATSLFVWLWYRWRTTFRAPGALAMGLAAGLMTLVREQNALLLLLPAVDWLATAPRRRVRAGVDALAIAVGFVVALLPQFLAWHALFGHYRPGAQRTSFFQPWLPHLGDVLFASNHGLFSWHPVWLVGLAGLMLLAVRKPALGIPLLAGFAAQALFLGSVTNWAGGMAFGQRRMLDCLFVVVVGAAVLFERIPRGVGGLGAMLFVWWNVSLLFQFGSGMIPREGPVSWRGVVYQQLVVVPQQVPALVQRYFDAERPFFRRSAPADAAEGGATNPSP